MTKCFSVFKWHRTIVYTHLQVCLFPLYFCFSSTIHANSACIVELITFQILLMNFIFHGSSRIWVIQRYKKPIESRFEGQWELLMRIFNRDNVRIFLLINNSIYVMLGVFIFDGVSTIALISVKLYCKITYKVSG